MSKTQTQTAEYWASSDFSLSEADIEQIYNHFLTAERPQTVEQISRIVIGHRIAEEQNALQKRLAGREIYQPRKSYAVGDELVFPTLQFAQGKVTAVRDASNPQFGKFSAVAIEINGETSEFAADLDITHPLNEGDGLNTVRVEQPDPEQTYRLYGEIINARVSASLQEHSEFIQLGDQWFVKGLMADISVGHLHLTEAVLEIEEGGPLPTKNILVHLELPKNIHPDVQEFSLNHALLNDDRFDEVAPPGQVNWFLRRLEPDPVQTAPDRLVYRSISYDPALLGTQLRQIIREIDDEWSNLDPLTLPRETTITLTYSHRHAGTLPLSARTKPLFPLGISQRQLIELVDDQTGESFNGWIVGEHRYVYGLAEWYAKNEIPVGSFIKLTPSDTPGKVLIGYSRRPRARREYVRLATVEDGKLRFKLEKREVGADYDDLMIVGTDTVAAVDALFQKATKNERSVSSLLAEIMPDLGRDGSQNAVHAKTLYSCINLLRRMPPGPLFAELVRHSAFHAVGDYEYWTFDANQWQRSN